MSAPSAFKPKLDRQLRLRAIRRLQTQRSADVATQERRANALDEASGTTRPKRSRSKAAAAKVAKATKPAKAKPAPRPAKP